MKEIIAKHKELIESFNNAVYVDTQTGDDGKRHIYFRGTQFAKKGIERVLGKEAVYMLADCYRIEVPKEN